MSPKSRRRNPPRHRPHEARRAQTREASETIPAELMSMMLAAGKDMVRGDGPLAAEEIASSLVGVWWGRDLIDAEVEEVIGEALVAEAARRRTAESLTLLTAVSSGSEGRLAIKAATAAQALTQLGVRGPEWLAEVGRVEPVAFYRSWDEAGDAISIIGLFAHEGDPPHAICVLIDRNMGGLAKDAWATGDGQDIVDQYRQACSRSDAMSIEEVDVATARAYVDGAFAVTERALPHDPPTSDELRSFRAMVLARMRLLPESREMDLYTADDLPFLGDGWDQERDRFLATPEVKALGRPRIVKGCVDAILEYGEFCDDGRLLRVSAVKVELLLVDWLPTWAGLSRSQVQVMPEVLRLWCRHTAARTRMPGEVVDEALASIDRFAPDFAKVAQAADASAYGFLREHVTGADVWERAEHADRLGFALLARASEWMFDETLETLEDDLHELAVRAHLEYDEDTVLAGDSSPDEDEVNPNLHLALHDIVANQLWAGDPPDVWRTVRRLQLGGYEPHEIHHMLMFAVGEPVRRAMVDRGSFDPDLYLTRLAELPGSWEALRQP